MSTKHNLHDIIDNIAAIAWEADASNWRFTFVSRHATKMLGYAVERWLQERDFWLRLLHPDDHSQAISARVNAMSTGQAYESEYRVVAADGRIVWVRETGYMTRNNRDQLLLRGLLLDITPYKQTEQELRDCADGLRDALDDVATGVALVTKDGRWQWVNRFLCELVGHPEPELLATTVADILFPEDRESYQRHVQSILADETASCQFEVRCLHKLGRTVWVQVTLAAVRDADARPLHLLALIHDLTARKEYESHLTYLATHDGLTGLFNRRWFGEELRAELAEARRYGTTGAVLFLDLDNFKDVNDTLGHAAGDQVLVKVAHVLRDAVREPDRVARVGGDEFAVLLRRISADQAEMAAQRLLESLRRIPVTVAGGSFHVTASIGLASIPGQEQTPDDLLARADLAMYRAKETGGNQVCLHQG